MGYFFAFIGLAVALTVAYRGWNEHECISQRGNWANDACVFSPVEPTP